MSEAECVKQLLKEIRDLRDWDTSCGLHPKSMVYILPSDSFELLVGCPHTLIADDNVSIYGIRIVESVTTGRRYDS